GTHGTPNFHPVHCSLLQIRFSLSRKLAGVAADLGLTGESAGCALERRRVEKFGQLGYRDLSELQRAFERRQRRLASNHRTTLALYPYLLGTCARHVGHGID